MLMLIVHMKQKILVAGSIQLAKVTVKAGKFNITNKKSTTQKVVVNNSDEVTIFDWEITAKDGRISVNDLIGLSVFDELDKHLVDTKNVVIHILIKLHIKLLKFSNLGDVSSNNPMKVKITAQPNIIDLTGSITFGVSAGGTDSNGNPVRASKVNAAKLEITRAAFC